MQCGTIRDRSRRDPLSSKTWQLSHNLTLAFRLFLPFISPLSYFLPSQDAREVRSGTAVAGRGPNPTRQVLVTRVGRGSISHTAALPPPFQNSPGTWVTESLSGPCRVAPPPIISQAGWSVFSVSMARWGYRNYVCSISLVADRFSVLGLSDLCNEENFHSPFCSLHCLHKENGSWLEPYTSHGSVTLVRRAKYVLTNHHNCTQIEEFRRVRGTYAFPTFPPSPIYDRAADLMPVVLLVGIDSGRTIGLMLNRRTGVLMGDLGDDFTSFMIQVTKTNKGKRHRSKVFERVRVLYGARVVYKHHEMACCCVEQGVWGGGRGPSAVLRAEYLGCSPELRTSFLSRFYTMSVLQSTLFYRTFFFLFPIVQPAGLVLCVGSVCMPHGEMAPIVRIIHCTNSLFLYLPRSASLSLLLRQQFPISLTSVDTYLAQTPSTDFTPPATLAGGHAGRERDHVHSHLPRGGRGAADLGGGGLVFLRRHGVRL